MRQIKATENYTLSKNKTTQVYLREIAQIPILTSDEELALAIQAQRGDPVAISKLAQANLRFVITVAKSYASREEEQQELVAVGNVGLLEAATKFDPSRGFKFISFAVWYIRKEIIDYIRKYKLVVTVPKHHLSILHKSKASRDWLYSQHGTEPTTMEVFEHFTQHSKTFEQLSWLHFQEVFEHPVTCSSFDKPFETGEEGSLYDLVPAAGLNPSELLARRESKENFERLLSFLPAAEKKALKLHFGVDCLYPHDYEAIGHHMGISEMKAMGAVKRAIQKLKYKIKNKGMKLNAILEV